MMDPIDLAKSVKPIQAYQGGPHRVGEEGYQNDKIGTGEGAQAYGHGHYFAEAEPIARHYRDTLTQGASNMTIDGQPFHQHYTSTDPEKRLKAKLAINMLHGDRDIQSAIDWQHQQTMGKLSSRHLMEEDIPEYMEDLKRLKIYKENPPVIEKNKGHMHEVAIHAHPDHFLDWDRPLSEQSEHVRNAMISRLEKFKKLGANFNNDPSGSELYRAAHPTVQLDDNIDWNKGLAEQASQHLLAHGIKGIRYLDAGSRGETGQPTHNYVVFDPKDIEIKRRYAEGGDVEGYATKGAVAGQKQYKQPFGPFQKGQLVSSEAAGPQDRPWERWVPSGYNSHEEVPIVNPQDLVGKRVGSLLADLTRAGGYYSGIDSSKVQNPEPMLGGPGYPLLPENQKHGLGWAVQGKGKGTAKLNKDFDYIAVHAMNPNSHLSNASMSNAVAKTMQAYVRDGRLSPDAVSKINDLIRSGAVNKKGEIDAKHQSLQDFPGFDHPEIQKFMKDMNFESRLKMYDILGQAKAEKLGAPSIEKIRRDTLSPQHAGDQYGSASYLLEVPRGSSDSLVNLAKSGLPIHPSYDWGVRGRVVGRFANPVSADILHKTWFDAKKEENKTKVTPKGKAPNIRRAFEMALPVTTITQEIADMLPHAPKDIQSSKAAQLALNAFNDKWGDTNTNVKQGGVGSADFARALRNSDSSSTLTQYTPEEINKMKKAGKFTGYKLKDGEVYFGLKHGTDYGDEYGFHHPDLTNNETALTSVVNNEPGAKGIGGAPVVLKALQHGATALDAYAVPTDRHPNGFLPDFYSHFGFEELGRVPFDPKYVTPQQYSDMKHEWAKTGWDEQRHGLPSLAIMKWRGSDADRQDAVRRFVSKGGEGFGARTGQSDVHATSKPLEQGAGSDIASPQGERGNGDAGRDRGAVRPDNAPRPSDRFVRTLGAVKTLQPHEAQNFGLNPADIEQAKASGLSTGGFLRRAYMKGGKVEGSIWHGKDANVEYGEPTNSAIVQHVLAKIAAPLPASVPPLGNVTGRRQ